MAGININLISIERLSQMSSSEKIRFILYEVRRGNVLVLEQGLTATEEAELIKTTMAKIDQDTFIGIEMQSYSQEDVTKGNWLSKLLRRKQPPRMSVIGPANLLKTIHKDGNMIQAMVLTRETIVGEGKGQGQRGPGPVQKAPTQTPTTTGQVAPPPQNPQTPQNTQTPPSTPKKEEGQPQDKDKNEGS
ncbi:MAG: DUF2073 domain-containing protein [Methanomassiliicoccales archaeon]|nr:MAG: DUF2073 domain-containing protein [Methanomassiliicoccales archaeon]